VGFFLHEQPGFSEHEQPGFFEHEKAGFFLHEQPGFFERKQAGKAPDAQTAEIKEHATQPAAEIAPVCAPGQMLDKGQCRSIQLTMPETRDASRESPVQ
jgi:hypothetical protein